MIAVVLVGIFAYVAIQGFYRCLNQQRRMLNKLEYSILVDLARMNVIADCWNNVQDYKEKKTERLIEISYKIKDKAIILNPKQEFKVESTTYPQSKFYLLTIEEPRPAEFKLEDKESTYHYFIKTHQESSTHL